MSGGEAGERGRMGGVGKGNEKQEGFRRGGREQRRKGRGMGGVGRKREEREGNGWGGRVNEKEREREGERRGMRGEEEGKRGGPRWTDILKQCSHFTLKSSPTDGPCDFSVFLVSGK